MKKIFLAPILIVFLVVISLAAYQFLKESKINLIPKNSSEVSQDQTSQDQIWRPLQNH